MHTARRWLWYGEMILDSFSHLYTKTVSLFLLGFNIVHECGCLYCADDTMHIKNIFLGSD